MTISTPSNTCPDCGVVGLGYICGSPDDPSNGLDCVARQGRTICEGCNASNKHPLVLAEVRGPFGPVIQVLCADCDAQNRTNRLVRGVADGLFNAKAAR